MAWKSSVADRPRSEVSQHVATEVRAYLARERISAKKAAAALGWSQPYLAKRLVGLQAFDLDDLSQLAELFGVDIRAFFEGPERSAGGGLNNLSKCPPAHGDLQQPVRPASLPPLAAVA